MKKNKSVSKQETQANILEHSQAKLDFYKNYLRIYLTILLQSPSTKKINIYDVFCGTGIYEDGKKGSPIIAIEAIKNALIRHKDKTITLTINDIDKKRVEKVKCFINEKFKDICELKHFSLDAEQMFSTITENIKKSKHEEKNLIFIDPYGYKKIYKQNIVDIMDAGRSEIILFLPISNMYRFSGAALSDKQNQSYEHLRRFISEFFGNDHPLYCGKYKNQLEYIEYIKDGLSVENKYFSASYHIQRDKKNYYSLFFITTHIYGLEKILETKWSLDNASGRGFTKKEPNLFEKYYKDEEATKHLYKIEENLKLFLATYRSNNDIYEYILRCGYLPKHANEILEKIREKLIFENEFKPRKKAFLLNWNNYKLGKIKYRVKIYEPKNKN